MGERLGTMTREERQKNRERWGERKREDKNWRRNMVPKRVEIG